MEREQRHHAPAQTERRQVVGQEAMNTRARKRILLALFLSLAVLIGLPVWLTWREVQQERLNRDLIVAIKQNKMAKAVALSNAGADANTKDSGNTLVSTRQVLRDWWDRLRGRKATATAFCPSALIVATHGNYMQSVTHPVVEPLPANPALFHYTQTIIHQGFVIIPP